MRNGLMILLAILLHTSLAAFGCVLVEDDAGPKGAAKVAAEIVAGGLQVPWSMAFLPNGRLLVTERAGRLRQIVDGNLMTEPLLTLPVRASGEGGLLGLAVHPNFEKTRFIYLYFTIDSVGKTINRVQRFLISPDGSKATADKVIVDGIPAARNHCGGRIRFGPNGTLFIGTGDAGSPSKSQSRESLSGKILRVDADGGIPKDNPFPGSPVFVSGLRNPEAFDWLDKKTLVIADHGPSGELFLRTGGDEVSLARAGDNLGWPDIWRCDQAKGMVTPLLTWKDSSPPGGGSFYRGNKIPAWKNSFLVGILRGRHLHRVALDEKTGALKSHDVYFEGDAPKGLGRIRDVLQGPDDYLYVTTSNCDGRGDCPKEKDSILRIIQR